MGAPTEPLNINERFLSMLRFDSRGKLDQLDIKLEIIVLVGNKVAWFISALVIKEYSNLGFWIKPPWGAQHKKITVLVSFL